MHEPDPSGADEHELARLDGSDVPFAAMARRASQSGATSAAVSIGSNASMPSRFSSLMGDDSPPAE